MVYKVYEEIGDFIRLSDSKRVNILLANQAHTPEGINIGWQVLDIALTSHNVESMIPGYVYAPLTDEERYQLEQQNAHKA